MQMYPFDRGSVLFERKTRFRSSQKHSIRPGSNFIQEAEIELHGIQLLRVNDCIRCTKLKANSGYKALMPPLFADPLELKESEPPLRQIVRSAWSRILEILVRGLDLDATDPRDKIFALLQLGEETWQSDLQPPELRPDYHKTTIQVFCDFARWWIVTHRSL